jgi:hypothetical protein
VVVNRSHDSEGGGRKARTEGVARKGDSNGPSINFSVSLRSREAFLASSHTTGTPTPPSAGQLNGAWDKRHPRLYWNSVALSFYGLNPRLFTFMGEN